MPFDPTPVPDDAVPISVGQAVSSKDLPGPHVYAFAAPGKRFFLTPQLKFRVDGQVPTNLGVYGPDPPELAGRFGKVTAPGVMRYARRYEGVRKLVAGTYYLVMRFEGEEGPYRLEIADNGLFHF